MKGVYMRVYDFTREIGLKVYEGKGLHERGFQPL